MKSEKEIQELYKFWSVTFDKEHKALVAGEHETRLMYIISKLELLREILGIKIEHGTEKAEAEKTEGLHKL